MLKPTFSDRRQTVNGAHIKASITLSKMKLFVIRFTWVPSESRREKLIVVYGRRDESTV